MVQVAGHRIHVALRYQPVNEGPAFALPLVRRSQHVVCHGPKIDGHTGREIGVVSSHIERVPQRRSDGRGIPSWLIGEGYGVGGITPAFGRSWAIAPWRVAQGTVSLVSGSSKVAQGPLLGELRGQIDTVVRCYNEGRPHIVRRPSADAGMSVEALCFSGELGVLVPERLDESSGCLRVPPISCSRDRRYTLRKLASAVASA